MKSLALERCWDQLRLVATMSNDLYLELYEMEQQLADIVINPGPYDHVGKEAAKIQSVIKSMANDADKIRTILDQWTIDNAPF